MQLTVEQQRILEYVRDSAHAGSAHAHILLHAYAGSGKSFILREIARLLPGPGIYLAFNKAIVADINRTLPSHFKAMTTHGLALQGLPTDIHKRVSASLKNDKGVVPLPVVMNQVKGFPQKNGLVLAGLALNTLRNFCNSGDLQIGPQHVPDGCIRSHRDEVVTQANRVWDAMLNFQIPVTHDFYFKAWTLMGQRLPFFHRLVDEAQDTNPALLSMLFSQQQGVTWWAGDPYQSIYGWRGAVDALSTVARKQNTYTDYLTRSFRFGDAPAALASRLLGALSEERPVQGTGQTDIRYAPLESRNPLPFMREFPRIAWLSFSNVTLLDVAVQCIEHGLSFHLVGQGKEEKSLVYAALKLKSGKPDPKGPLAAYAKWSDLEEEARSVPEGDASKLLRLYRHPGFGAILDGLQRSTPNEADARVILTTVHRAKGREWDFVVIDPDLDASEAPTTAQTRKQRRFFIEDGTLRFDNREDIHLRYVAVTRARKCLLLGCPQLYQWWRQYA